MRDTVTVGFITLGCAKNLVDSQVMAGYLKDDAVAFAPSPEKADVILVNTCAFIESAREEAAEAILSVCEHKRRGGCRAVVVAGCMVQRYRSRMEQAFPDVDAFVGIDELERVAGVVRQVAEGKRLGLVATKGKAIKLYNPAYPSLLFTGGPYGYLKIAEGCDHRCAYCAIPGIRGSFRSRDTASLLQEARGMVVAGVREINLISQDSLRFGADRGAEGSIVALLRELDAIEGDFWLRILYGYPSAVSDELLDAMRESRHVCRYLDLPIQHSHPEVLKAMNRGKAAAAIATLPARLREALPGVVLRTTCLVGFPGETEEHFQHLLEYVAAARFDHLGAFAYSPEEDTAAFDMQNQIEPELADERLERLMTLQRRIVRSRAKELIGTRHQALLLRRQARGWLARLPRQAPEVDGETRVLGVAPTARAGDFVEVRIKSAPGYNLTAEAL